MMAQWLISQLAVCFGLSQDEDLSRDGSEHFDFQGSRNRMDTKIKVTGSEVPYHDKSPDYSKVMFNTISGNTLKKYTLNELKNVPGGPDALRNFDWYQVREKKIEDYISRVDN
ncbi:uncharacterized protein N7483_002472 [Penicillium malachiteum]|uniref:uncharacterized protein n=1 Tax=Penicillium malachiteum TaxID=1324776 RepID=UPI00254698EA|nr:uncharacterized protein N7483_002472 [Penicillium malachiteum]KAJ5737347.1 hypothetical protein N7483_002472 [Penicillium malachiteum]